MLYGSLDLKSGSWPTIDKSFLISGEVIDNKYLFQIQDAFDSDTANTFFSYRLFGNTIFGEHHPGGYYLFRREEPEGHRRIHSDQVRCDLLVRRLKKVQR